MTGTDARARGGWKTPVAAFALSLGLLGTVQLGVRRPMLLAERFLPGAGWGEAVLLSLWAAFLASRLVDPSRVGRWRTRLWALFSAAFFLQLAVGLAGVERFLMTGTLHLPVPAMIVGGPAFRGEGWFMPTLLAVTLLLVGPAWCSYLCYLGAWDLLAARARRRPAPLPRWRGWVRWALLAAVPAVALVLRLAGASGTAAALAGGAFGVVGVAVMGLSARAGAMVHCTSYCPIGVLAAWGGRLSPFRLRIVRECTDCGACTTACRYDALSEEDVRARRPGSACTLCGDCLRTCKGRFIEYRLPGLGAEGSRAVFVALVAALHAVFLGVARI